MIRQNPYLRQPSNYTTKSLIDWFLSVEPHRARTTSTKAQNVAYRIFFLAKKYVKAYRSFLKKSGFTKQIQRMNQTKWKQVPITDKLNYITQYPLSDLAPQIAGHTRSQMISLSSGSSGNAYFWPREAWQEIEGAMLHEQILTELFHIERHKTLVVVLFSMGSYLAGTYTAQSIRWVAHKGYNLSLITPGINLDEALREIRQLSPNYEQVILAGYPPFIKDLLEKGEDEGLKWSKMQLKILFASEFFSEKWRDGIGQLAGIKNVLTDTTNIYGASEGTIFGWETKETMYLRRLAAQNPELHRALFHSDLTPTLVVYNPALRYFEEENGRLIVTTWAGIPLIRYDLKDNGGILTAQDRHRILHQFGINYEVELGPKYISDLPMVYVLGRSDLAASIYGVLIYPEYIKIAIENEGNKLTGKFSIDVTSTTTQNPVLDIHVELKNGKRISPLFQKRLSASVRQTLTNKSREYAALEAAVGDKAWPRVYLHKYGSAPYFMKNIKQKWISH